MNLPEHILPVQNERQRSLAKRWLLLGVAALGLAGMFAGMLADIKSPFFYMALVAHVDLSVLVWFLAFSGMMMALAAGQGRWSGLLENAGFLSLLLGTGMIAASAFTGGAAYQNNYVPVIYHPLFFLGIALLFCGMLCVVASLLVGGMTEASAVRAGVVSAAVIYLMAAFCFLWSYHTMPQGIHGQSYYDDVFWAGGHMLQIAYAQMLLVAWLWLAESAGLRLKGKRRLVLTAYALGISIALAGLGIAFAFPVSMSLHHNGFTMLMKHGNGLPALLVGVMVAYALITAPPSQNAAHRLPAICLVMSLVLFAAGGALGYLIAGSTVTTPAHYHGSIVGVTLAFMGVAYSLLPRLGWRDAAQSRLARLQPVLYGGGQLCWMAGMAIGGAQGVGRKIPGSADVIGGLGGFLKHGGDGLSLIGGLLFVVVVAMAVRGSEKVSQI